MIYFYLKFHEIQSRGYLVIANYMYFKSSQGLSLLITKASLTRLDVHQCLIVIYIFFKFDEIRFKGHLVIAIGQINSRAITHELPRPARPNMTCITSL